MRTPAWDAVGIGENSIDEVCRVPALPGANAKMAIRSRRLAPGGQVATAMCACARLGLRARYVGAFGADENGARVREALEQHGVETSAALTRDAPNRYAVVLVAEGTGDRVVLSHRDPALTIHPGELDDLVVSGTRLLHVDATDAPLAIAAARVARASGVRVTSDIEAVTDHTRELIGLVDVAIMAEGVPRALTGEHDAEAALRVMRRQYPAWLCVTLGNRGAMLLGSDRLHRCGAFPVNAVDTTGAGDVFRAGFIYALLRGDEPPQILRFANAAAAVSCTREGAIDSVPSLEEVAAVLDGTQLRRA